MNPVTRLSAMLLVCLLYSSGTAYALEANTVFMCDFVNQSKLYRISTTTGKVLTPPGAKPMGISLCSDLAFRNSSLYATTYTRLYAVNTSTGHATARPNTYGPGINDVVALVAQPGTGKILGGGINFPGRFIEIDPTTGKATPRGNIGSSRAFWGDMAFLNGSLYATIRKNGQGDRTFLAKLTLNAQGNIGTVQELGMIRTTVNGTLYYLKQVWSLTVRNGILFGGNSQGYTVRINPANGVVTYPSGFAGINYLPMAGFSTSP
ncbi:MAG: hypothetical protein PHI13_15980 [Methylococcales bacterium]|nr:hypothetical protein [Methylococcales bacterium]